MTESVFPIEHMGGPVLRDLVRKESCSVQSMKNNLFYLHLVLKSYLILLTIPLFSPFTFILQ